jgi:hypothetical protein
MLALLVHDDEEFLGKSPVEVLAAWPEVSGGPGSCISTGKPFDFNSRVRTFIQRFRMVDSWS